MGDSLSYLDNLLTLVIVCFFSIHQKGYGPGNSVKCPPSVK